MIREISLEAVIQLVGHKRGMRNREVVAALADCAGSSRAINLSRFSRLPEPSILRVRWGTTLRHHNVLLRWGKVYDPENDGPIPLADFVTSIGGHGRIVSVFPVRGIDDKRLTHR